VAVEPQLAIYRDTGIALIKRGETYPEAKEFADFLSSGRGGHLREMGLDAGKEIKGIGRHPPPSLNVRIFRLI
jgi:hypothetical protein